MWLQGFKNNPSLPADKQLLTAVPDVRQFYALPSESLLLACDGMPAVCLIKEVSVRWGREKRRTATRVLLFLFGGVSPLEGLFEELELYELEAIMSTRVGKKPLVSALSEVVDKAIEAGSGDNISLAYVHLRVPREQPSRVEQVVRNGAGMFGSGRAKALNASPY